MTAAELADAILADPEALARLAQVLGTARTVHTTATLAAELDVSERTIRRAIEAGELPATRRCGRWVMLAEDVAAWARTGTAPRTRARRSPACAVNGTTRGAAAMLAAVEAKR